MSSLVTRSKTHLFRYAALAAAACLLSAAPVIAKPKKTTPTPVPPVPADSTSSPLPGPVAVPTNTLQATMAATVALPKDMKLLVITAAGTDPSFNAIKSSLDHLAMPYDVLVSKDKPLPALSNAEKGFYSGVILTDSQLVVCDTNPCRTTLSDADWVTLNTYLATYKARLVSLYTWPTAAFGLQFSQGFDSGLQGDIKFLTGSETVFPYLNRTQPMKISGAYAYLATTVAASGETTTPILSLSGFTVAAIHKKADGREILALTFDNAPHLVHSLAFGYGILNWVSKGMFLGYRKVYMTPQVDDQFLADDLFVGSKPACRPVLNADETYDPADTCPTLRITGADLDDLVRWQNSLQNAAITKNFKLTLAYNGFGLTADGGAPILDTLKLYSSLYKDKFYWVNHTWDHENLDCYDPVPNSGICNPATYAQSAAEITQNVKTATSLRLPLDKTAMVTPAISGLKNTEFLRAAAGNGIRYLVGDMSRPEGTPASPNTAIASPNSNVWIIPRRATNVFYNVTTPGTGVAGSEVDEYNYMFGPGGLFGEFFKQKQTYAQIVDAESQLLLGNMLRYEMYPNMWHQSNLRAYDGTNSLMSDVIGATFKKYSAISTLPVVSLSQSEIGKALESRMAYNASGVVGTMVPGTGIVLTVTKAATIPVTGVCYGTCETYGSQQISYVQAKPGTKITIPVTIP